MRFGGWRNRRHRIVPFSAAQVNPHALAGTGSAHSFKAGHVRLSVLAVSFND